MSREDSHPLLSLSRPRPIGVGSDCSDTRTRASISEIKVLRGFNTAWQMSESLGS